MKNKKQIFVVRIGLAALAVFLLLPVTASAQGNGRGRGKPTEIFVNGHDARDGRYDTAAQRDRRRYDNDEWRRRQAAEEARRRRDNGGYGNYGGYGGDFRQTALNAGYNNGMQEGRKD
ncbi:MAG TPA: hypothetical protein VGC61_06805, partial [Pyrinomonadaceae bacterium]